MRDILIIHLSGLGNSILLYPLVYALNKSGCRVHMLVRDRVVIDLFAPCGLVEHWQYYRRAGGMLKRTGARIKALTEIHRFEYDLAISTELRQTIGSAMLMRAVRATKKCGVSNGSRHDPVYDSILNYCEADSESSLYESFLELADVAIATPPLPFFSPTLSETRAVDRAFDDDRRDKPLVGLHLGCNPIMQYKRWPVARFAELCRYLIHELNVRPVIFGGRDEEDLAAELLNICSDGVVNLVGHFSIRETAAAIGRCRIFVSNDSGLMHIAAAMGVPVVAVFGPTSVTKNALIGNGHVLLHGGGCHKSDNQLCGSCAADFREKSLPPKCLQNIQVEDVFAAVQRKLGVSPAVSRSAS